LLCVGGNEWQAADATKRFEKLLCGNQVQGSGGLGGEVELVDKSILMQGMRHTQTCNNYLLCRPGITLLRG